MLMANGTSGGKLPTKLVVTDPGLVAITVIELSETPCCDAAAFSVGAAASRRFCSVLSGIDSANAGPSTGDGTGRKGTVENPACAAWSESRGSGNAGGCGGETGNDGSSIQSPKRNTGLPCGSVVAKRFGPASTLPNEASVADRGMSACWILLISASIF